MSKRLVIESGILYLIDVDGSDDGEFADQKPSTPEQLAQVLRMIEADRREIAR